MVSSSSSFWLCWREAWPAQGCLDHVWSSCVLTVVFFPLSTGLSCLVSPPNWRSLQCCKASVVRLVHTIPPGMFAKTLTTAPQGSLWLATPRVCHPPCHMPGVPHRSGCPQGPLGAAVRVFASITIGMIKSYTVQVGAGSGLQARLWKHLIYLDICFGHLFGHL